MFSPPPSQWLLPSLLQRSQAGGQLAFLAPGTQTGVPWKPPERARHRNRNKTLSSPETKSGPFHDDRGRPLVRDAGRLLALSLTCRGPGPQPKDGRREEKGV